ncbi:MAG: amylo-alpha-1,6-glucosidase [Actinomycetia bacterium]|nr:amylo-alpha-1,6-glucosidase [Actinomycetes bacterium]
MSSRDEPVVLKSDQLFFVQPATFLTATDGGEAAGLYHEDTRFLRGLTWQLGDQPLVTLSSAVQGTSRAQIDLTNPALVQDGHTFPPGTVHLRVTVLMADRLYLRVRVTNFATESCRAELRMRFEADFRDIFEVRGWSRARRGELDPPRAADTLCVFRYRGLDEVARTTRVEVAPAPRAWHVLDRDRVEAVFPLALAPRDRHYLYIVVTPHVGETTADPPRSAFLGRQFTTAALTQARAQRAWQAQCTHFETDNPQVNAALSQATADMRALLTEYPDVGHIVDAGIPWYVAPFGRDAAITSIETLLLTPDLAKMSLRFLARLQGTRVDPLRDEEPGKILHEWRRGEMARCGEIPHTPYYGSLDSTLWWIIALYETWRFSNDRPFLEEMAPALHRAVDWIVHYGDRDGDGLLEYMRQAPGGLDNQGWKDSADSVLDDEGRPLTPPIAPVEVQGYAYRALRVAAEMFGTLGDARGQEAASRHADRLRQRFWQQFWDPEARQVAYALDGHKRPLFQATSNVGHLLFTEILPPFAARALARRLFQPELLSGYGIRTLGQSVRHYNPMSYHNGSVWPHDNAIIAWGLRILDQTERLVALADQLYEASRYFPYGRLPELYCGFTRRPGAGPVPYPVACDPQAWSTAVPFFLLRLLLGLSCQGNRVHIYHPVLPPWIRHLYLRNFRIGGGVLDIEFARERGATFANVVRREGDIRILIEPRA